MATTVGATTSAAPGTLVPSTASSLTSSDIRRPIPGRKCFVTVGATAGFRPLLAAVLEPAFLSALSEYGYDRLEVQCGPERDLVWFRKQVAETSDLHGLDVQSFGYAKDLAPTFLQCRAERVDGVQYKLAGCVVSHAGSGTILEVLRVDAPLIVVANPALMNNHQAELARECERKGWAAMGDLKDLTPALHRSWQQKDQGRLDFLPPYRAPPFPVPEADRIKVLDWMVLTCYPEELQRQLRQQELVDAGRAAEERQARRAEEVRREEQSRQMMD